MKPLKTPPERLEYQKQYNVLNKEKIKVYQREYFQKKKAERNKGKVKPLITAYKKLLLERLIKKKFKKFLESEKVANPGGIVLVSYTPEVEEVTSFKQPAPFSDFVRTKNGFTLIW
jgi:hypothetical protein